MRKSVLIPVAAFLAVITMLAACKKDEQGVRKEMLVGKWVESFTADDKNSNNIIDQDEKQIVTAPQTMEFASDGSGKLSGPITSTCQWSLSHDEKNITITIQGSAETSRIYSLDVSSFVMEHIDEDTGELYWEGYIKQ